MFVSFDFAVIAAMMKTLIPYFLKLTILRILYDLKHVRIVYNIPPKSRDAKQFDCFDYSILHQNKYNGVTIPTKYQTLEIVGRTAIMWTMTK